MSPARLPFPQAFTCALLLGLALLLTSCASREERIQEVQAEANAALFVNDSAAAIKALSKGLSKFPDSNELRIALSRAHQNAGNLEQAAALLEEAIDQDPDADQLWVKIGEIRSSLGKSSEAIVAFQAYLKNHANDFLAWKSVAIENEKLGKLTDAIKAASKWNDITPSSQPALKLGELYLASRNVPQARSWFSQAAAYGDEYAAKSALAELIKLEISNRQLEQAATWMAEFEKRYGKGSADPRIRESKTILENWDRARKEIAEAAAELEMERSELEAERIAEEKAEAERQAQELASSLDNNEQPTIENTFPQDRETEGSSEGDSSTVKPPLALFDDDSSPEMSENVATNEGQPVPQDDEPQVTDSLALSPFEEAVAAYEDGDYAESTAMFWDLLADDSDDPQLWYRLSLSCYAQQNWYDAESAILEARRRAPRSEVIANQYLLTIAKTQNTNRALEEMKAIKLLFPNSPPIALTLAQTLKNVKAPRSIVAAAYRDYLALANPGEAGYQEANRYLQTGN